MTPEPAEHQTRSVEQFHLDGSNNKAKDGTGSGHAIDVAGLERPETVNHFSVAANVRSIRSTLRSSARSSPANPPRAFSFSNSASFSAAVPCISRKSATAVLFFAFGSFRFRNIATSRFTTQRVLLPLGSKSEASGHAALRVSRERSRKLN